jgi:hypothetical protein
VLVSGAAAGPMLFEMAELLGCSEVNERLRMALNTIKN